MNNDIASLSLGFQETNSETWTPDQVIIGGMLAGKEEKKEAG